MTGFGRARAMVADRECVVEIRSVNHRFLSVRYDLPSGFARFEGEIERLLKERVLRGSVTVSVRLHRPAAAHFPLPPVESLRDLYGKLVRAKHAVGQEGVVPFEALFAIPGIWNSGSGSEEDVDPIWPGMRKLIEGALKELETGRCREGRLIRNEIESRTKMISQMIKKIEGFAPRVAQGYRQRLQERVNLVLQEMKVELQPIDLAREFAVFADRCDISEEVSRLKFHVDKMKSFLKEEKPVGRNLDFLIQEMTREINTLASKANDGPISALAVEVKGEVEKIREQAENVQ